MLSFLLINNIDFFTSSKPFLKVKQKDQEGTLFKLDSSREMFDVDFDVSQIQQET